MLPDINLFSDSKGEQGSVVYFGDGLFIFCIKNQQIKWCRTQDSLSSRNIKHSDQKVSNLTNTFYVQKIYPWSFLRLQLHQQTDQDLDTGCRAGCPYCLCRQITIFQKNAKEWLREQHELRTVPNRGNFPSRHDDDPVLESKRDSIYWKDYNLSHMRFNCGKGSSVSWLSLAKWISKLLEVAVMHVVV